MEWLLSFSCAVLLIALLCGCIHAHGEPVIAVEAPSLTVCLALLPVTPFSFQCRATPAGVRGAGECSDHTTCKACISSPLACTWCYDRVSSCDLV